ncbi:hypothetical protein QQ045_023744 [Rhodiola kirilowii]
MKFLKIVYHVRGGSQQVGGNFFVSQVLYASFYEIVFQIHYFYFLTSHVSSLIVGFVVRLLVVQSSWALLAVRKKLLQNVISLDVHVYLINFQFSWKRMQLVKGL